MSLKIEVRKFIPFDKKPETLRFRIFEYCYGSEFPPSNNDLLLPKRPRVGIKLCLVIPWLLATTFGLTTLILSLLCFGHNGRNEALTQKGTYQTGFQTELADARKNVETVEVTFTGSLEYTNDGDIYAPSPGPLRYAGNPEEYPEVNRNWNILVDGRFIRITEEEAYKAWGDTYRDYWNPKDGAYVASFEMFHALHCLHHLQRAYYPEFYFKTSALPEKELLHRDHCIEHVRQVIMCHGDMTPIPTKYFKPVDRNYAFSDVPHTCRNFDKLQGWLVDRYNGPTSIRRYNKTENSGG